MPVTPIRWAVPGPMSGTYSMPTRPTAQVNTDLCTSCGRCIAVCPTQAISLSLAGKAVVNTGVCQGCGACAAECPFGAISLLTPAFAQQH